MCDCPVYNRMTLLNSLSEEVVSWELNRERRPEIDADIVAILQEHGFTIVEWIVRCPMCHSTAARGVVQ